MTDITRDLPSSTSTSTPRQPKAAKQPKTPTSAGSQAAQGAQDGDGKGKSAKELKKEKRAAAVSSRVGTEGPGGSGGPGGARFSGRGGPVGAGGLPTDGPTKTRPNLTSSGPSTSTSQLPTSNLPARRALGQTQPTNSGDPHNPHSSQNLFFSHLPPHHPPNTPQAYNTSKLHPEIIRLGVLMSEGALRGANARTMAMMAAFQEVIRDYECHDQAVLWKDLPVYLSPMIAWLEGCRPKGVGGGNAIRWLKSEINKLGEEDERTEIEQKAYLVEAIGVYIRDRIEFADQVIADHAKEKIRPGETVVTFARSSVVEWVLLEAWREMRKEDPCATFEVIVVDSRPLNEGRALLDSLTSAGLQCTYLLLPLLSSVLLRASLVLLGASALHSDGALYSRAGTALVAMLAKEHRVPVVACVETYKFGERVVLDGVASNELGDPDEFAHVPINKAVGTKTPLSAHLTPLSLMYDLTPPSLITAVCTEIGFIPPSSVPTVLGKASGVV